ncbi:MAG: hypothetical protein ACO1SV_08245 [Fimbriimonas sp.]
MRHFLLLALAALSAASFATVGRVTAAGTYRLVPDDATRAFCRRHRIEMPTGKLVLREDRTFSLTVTDDEGVHRTLGNYAVREDQVEFFVEEGEGLDLPREMRLNEDGLGGRGALFERDEEPAPVAPRRPKKRLPRIEAPAEPIREVLPPVVRTVSVKGTWTLRRNGSEDRSTRFTFNDDGTFRFIGMNAESRGRYVCEGDSIVLIWHEIDGERVSDGHSVRKRLPLDEGGFYVDDYRYERQR